MRTTRDVNVSKEERMRKGFLRRSTTPLLLLSCPLVGMGAACNRSLQVTGGFQHNQYYSIWSLSGAISPTRPACLSSMALHRPRSSILSSSCKRSCLWSPSNTNIALDHLIIPVTLSQPDSCNCRTSPPKLLHLPHMKCVSEGNEQMHRHLGRTRPGTHRNFSCFHTSI